VGYVAPKVDPFHPRGEQYWCVVGSGGTILICSEFGGRRLIIVAAGRAVWIRSEFVCRRLVNVIVVVVVVDAVVAAALGSFTREQCAEGSDAEFR